MKRRSLAGLILVLAAASVSAAAEKKPNVVFILADDLGYVNAVAACQKFPKELWDGREQKPSQGYADTLFADRAIDFIKRHQAEPFFLYVPFIATHGLVAAPQEEIDSFKGKFKEADPD